MKEIYLLIIILVLINIYIYNYANENFDFINGNHKDYELVNYPNYIERKNKDNDIYNDVPLDIYQSWHSHEVPIDMAENIDNLIEMNPEFNYHLFSDDDCRDFIIKHFDDDVLFAFNILKPGAYKADLWRYCVLYINGGVYLDIKFYSVVPIISLIKDNSVVFVKDRDWGVSFLTCQEGIYNAFIISPKNNIIFKHAIDKIVNNCKLQLYGRNALDVTGPCLIGSIILEHSPEKYDEYVDKYKYTGDFIEYNNKVIFAQYPTYRDNLKLFQKTKHYSTAWWEKSIFNKHSKIKNIK